MKLIIAFALLIACSSAFKDNCFTKIEGRFTNWGVFTSIPGYKAGANR